MLALKGGIRYLLGYVIISFLFFISESELLRKQSVYLSSNFGI